MVLYRGTPPPWALEELMPLVDSVRAGGTIWLHHTNDGQRSDPVRVLTDDTIESLMEIEEMRSGRAALIPHGLSYGLKGYPLPKATEPTERPIFWPGVTLVVASLAFAVGVLGTAAYLRLSFCGF